MTDLEHSERLLDAAIECTFPASDPIAVQHAFASACAREEQAAPTAAPSTPGALLAKSGRAAAPRNRG